MSSFNRTTLSVALSLLAAVVLVQPAAALTATANLGVSADVTDNCTIDTTPVAFGNYDPIVVNTAAALNGTGEVLVRCTNGDDDVIVTLGQGSNAGGGSTDAAPVRRMISGTDLLSYALFLEPTRTVTWGNTALTGLGYTGTGTEEALVVFGSVAGAQNVPAGNYSDTVLATVTF